MSHLFIGAFFNALVRKEVVLYMAEEFRINLGIQLNNGQLNNVQNQINNIRVNPINLQINTRNVQNQINSIRRQLQGLNNIIINLNRGGGGGGNGGGNQGRVNETLRAYRELVSLQSRLSSKMTALDKLDTLDTSKSRQEIVELTTQINNLYTRYQDLYRLVSNRLTPMQTDTLNRGFETLSERLNIINSQLRDTNSNLVNTINTNFDNGTFANELSTIYASLAKIRTQSSGVVDGMQQLNTAFSNMQTARTNGDIANLINSYHEYESALKNVKNQIELNLRTEKQYADAEKLNNERNAFASKMDIWLSRNSAAAEQFGAEIDNLKIRLQNCDKVELGNIKTEFEDVKRRAEEAGKTGLDFSDRFKKQMGRLSSYLSASALIGYSIRALRSMYNEVLEVDTAMTELKKVTDETADSYKEFLSNAGTSAKEIGTTVSGIISSTADFARLGYSFEDSQELAKVANIYAVVGDEVGSVEDATKSLISTMAAFNIQASDSMSIVDKFNEVGNNYAISSGGVGEALKRSASSLAAANSSLDESIALITAANTVVQNPETVGE